ncbi:EGF-like domain-containing protein 1 [Biomphalaria pfeifferi]|uniref:EGF-like domain-containing protein 1 n=1 Tax=Biomphalaria pfeifferi TaxID=112525 RepID=A0AAD8C6U7_BIOPF|nr:EGF-like domain-containing protein 1 [Biomphalaria pfeifferi]
MYVNINPYGDPQFQGYIYAYGYDRECIFNETGNITIPPFVKNSTLLKGYGIELKHIGSKCGNATSKNNTPSSTTFVRRFFVQYDKDIKSPVDQLVTAQCTVEGGDTILVSSQTTLVEEQGSGYKEVNFTSSSSGVTLEIQSVDSKTLTEKSAVKLGPSPLKVENCTASDVGPSTPRIQFLTNGCPVMRYKSIYVTSRRTDSASFEISLKAFRFNGNNNIVIFTCAIKLCSSSSDECQMPTCSSTGVSNTTKDNTPAQASNTTAASQNFTTTAPLADNSTTAAPPAAPENNSTATGEGGKRKRRDATAGNSTVTGSIKVLDPDEADTSGGTGVSEACTNQRDYLAAVIVLGVFASCLAITTIVLLVILKTSRSKVVPHRQNTFNSPVQTMKLPRLDLHGSTSHQPF